MRSFSGIRSSRASASSVSPRSMSISASASIACSLPGIHPQDDAQALLVAGFDQLGDRGLLVGRQQVADELRDHVLRIGAHEAVDDLAVLHREDRRDRLHLEGLADGRVLVDVDLDQHDLALGRVGDLLEDRTERQTWSAPRGPEVDHDGGRLRSLDHIGIERCVGDIDRHGTQDTCESPTATVLLLQARGVRPSGDAEGRQRYPPIDERPTDG